MTQEQEPPSDGLEQALRDERARRLHAEASLEHEQQRAAVWRQRAEERADRIQRLTRPRIWQLRARLGLLGLSRSNRRQGETPADEAPGPAPSEQEPVHDATRQGVAGEPREPPRPRAAPTYPAVRVAALTSTALWDDLLAEFDTVDIVTAGVDALADCDLALVEAAALETAPEPARTALHGWRDLPGRSPLVVDPRRAGLAATPFVESADLHVRWEGEATEPPDRTLWLEPFTGRQPGTVSVPQLDHRVTGIVETDHLVVAEGNDGPLAAWQPTRDGHAAQWAAVRYAARGVPVFDEEGVLRTADDASLRWKRPSPDLVGQPVDSGLRRASVLARRWAHSGHTTAARASALLRALGIPHAPPHTDITGLLMSNRPHLLPAAIARFEAQDHAERALVIGMHGGATAEERARITVAVEAADVPIDIIEVPTSVPLGEGLNRLAERASSRYLAKIDDDDYYGPSYLTDAVQALSYGGRPVIGKATYMVYITADDHTYLVNRGKEEQEATETQVHGGTLAMQRSAWEACPFPSRPQRVDSLFLRAARAVGLAVYSTNAFEFVCIRGGKGHTWDVSLSRFRARGVPIAEGLPHELLDVAGTTG